MARFSVGSRVRIIGGIAEYYSGVNPVVMEVIPNDMGLSYLTRYLLLISDHVEDTFYEFQLAPDPDREKMRS